MISGVLEEPTTPPTTKTTEMLDDGFLSYVICTGTLLINKHPTIKLIITKDNKRRKRRRLYALCTQTDAMILVSQVD